MEAKPDLPGGHFVTQKSSFHCQGDKSRATECISMAVYHHGCQAKQHNCMKSLSVLDPSNAMRSVRESPSLRCWPNIINITIYSLCCKEVNFKMRLKGKQSLHWVASYLPVIPPSVFLDWQTELYIFILVTFSSRFYQKVSEHLVLWNPEKWKTLKQISLVSQFSLLEKKVYLSKGISLNEASVLKSLNQLP